MRAEARHETQYPARVDEQAALHWDSVIVAAGRPARTPDAPLNTPIVPTSSLHAGGEWEYAREGSLTVHACEEALAAAEGARHAITFASGMAAANAVMDTLEHGTHVIAPTAVYTGVGVRLRELAQRGVISLTQVDASETPEITRLLHDGSPGGLCLWLESPTNPLLEPMDLEHLLAEARSAGALSVVDNTFATPARQQPIALGADVVLHSVTKALSGHSDLLMGALITNDAELAERFRIRRVLLGAAPSAFDAFLALRGLRTLGVRVDRSEATARDLVTQLATHPKVTKVRYPGWGSLISIEIDATPEGIDQACAGFGLWTFATSLGGVESLAERRRRWALESPVVPVNLVRLSVGLEHPNDLWADLSAMLDRA